MSKLLVDTLNGTVSGYPPVWFMRQAGRHLPEYLALREKAKNFIDFCMRPDMASEATLQPIRRYDMDGAILFADILLTPMAMGRSVEFIKGRGPVLEPIDAAGIAALKTQGAAERLSNIYETVRLVREDLASDKTLIGFAGGCWTVATYMIEGHGTPTKETAKRFAYENSEAMQDLLDALVDVTAHYLIEQAKAGADVLKIFESWAEGLSPAQFEFLVINPTRRIVDKIRGAGITVPIMGFPRGAGMKASAYARQTGITAIAAGTDTSIADLRSVIPKDMPVQGNLDPLLLRLGGKAMHEGVARVLEDGRGGPHIFNLGHGVTPDVKISDVHAVINQIRNG